MATSTFDRNITLTDPASVKKFYRTERRVKSY